MSSSQNPSRKIMVFITVLIALLGIGLYLYIDRQASAASALEEWTAQFDHKKIVDSCDDIYVPGYKSEEGTEVEVFDAPTYYYRKDLSGNPVLLEYCGGMTREPECNPATDPSCDCPPREWIACKEKQSAPIPE